MATQTKLGIVILEEQPFMRSAFAREIEDHASLELRDASGLLDSANIASAAQTATGGVLLVGCRSLTAALAAELEPLSVAGGPSGIALLCTDFEGEAVAHAQRLCSTSRKGFGLFLKDSIYSGQDLEQFVLSVGTGNVVIDPRVIGSLMESPVRPSSAEFSSLTDREIDVLELMTRGLTNMGIADELGVQWATADRHIHNIYSKLGNDGPSNISLRTHAVSMYNAALQPA
ncbi:MAG: LuxR C-terminal-related transcriptional regulator [Chloroflexi bacterium]|nr:LuxR C-terminal-related transcriptional regulator [Chloroflexota bacterium]MDA1174343.1 LuxR C-terminal-related transcriptional regulator [Chloroflexota bacterium]